MVVFSKPIRIDQTVMVDALLFPSICKLDKLQLTLLADFNQIKRTGYMTCHSCQVWRAVIAEFTLCSLIQKAFDSCGPCNTYLLLFLRVVQFPEFAITLLKTKLLWMKVFHYMCHCSVPQWNLCLLCLPFLFAKVRPKYAGNIMKDF